MSARLEIVGDRLLPPTVMNEAILFLASRRAAGISGEKITARTFSRWLAARGPEAADGAAEQSQG